MEFPPIIKALMDPEAYPERPGSVELRQTHISYIFFTPEFVYKIKKPVDFGFLDFTTLDKRKKFCHEELRLNRRLAPDVYIGVVPINEKDGRVSVGGVGETVEYAVKMRRIKSATILEEQIKKDTVTLDTVRRIAGKIATFHKNAHTNAEIARFGAPGVISENTEENFTQTSNFVGQIISKGLYNRIREYTAGFIDRHKKVFAERIQGGFIKDCHGDIHSEHISTDGSVEIIDCIEFNERFRYSDTVADIAFLSMDLDFHNRPALSRAFTEAYFKYSGDEGGRQLVNFYKCYRAYVRAKVEGLKYLEPEVEEGERINAFIRARRYFHLAGQYAGGGVKPLFIIICGLSGTGKSLLARAIAGRTWAVHLSSDAIRKALAGVLPGTHKFESFGKGIYSGEFTERTYSALISAGIEELKAGRTCILDATFSKNKFIDMAVKGAGEAGVPDNLIHVIECTATDGLIKERLLKRLKEGAVKGQALPDMTWELYLKQKGSYEKKVRPRIIVEGGRTLNKNLLTIINRIFGDGGAGSGGVDGF